MTLHPGDLVTAAFPGVQGLKRRPAVVVSTDEYHRARPDVILSVITSNVQSATESTDYLLVDWQAAGLRRASAFRTFVVTLPANSVSVIGRLSDQDWDEVQNRLRLAVAGQ